MSPFISRIVAALLVPCLLADPAWSTALQPLPLGVAPDALTVINTTALDSRHFWLNAALTFKKPGQRLRANIYRSVSGPSWDYLGAALRMIGWYEAAAPK